MFTHKDISSRTIFIINCIDNNRHLRVSNGELMLEQIEEDKHTTLTKFPFQKIFALFVIGNISITTPLIDKCKRNGIAIVVMTISLRPVFVWANTAEANYLLRKRQFELPDNDLSIARNLVYNKILNQLNCLRKTRRRDANIKDAIDYCTIALDTVTQIDDYNNLMGLEGYVAKLFFANYFQNSNWKGRHPRTKCDELNVTLDIGYTILFNYMECFLRLFGFDLYVGVYHRLWFKRKSLVCDLIEPFRCIIDHATLLAFNRGQFKTDDFALIKHEYRLKQAKNTEYYKVFYDTLISHKSDFFKYAQQYYRCFMGCKSINSYPKFEFK